MSVANVRMQTIAILPALPTKNIAQPHAKRAQIAPTVMHASPLETPLSMSVPRSLPLVTPTQMNASHLLLVTPPKTWLCLVVPLLATALLIARNALLGSPHGLAMGSVADLQIFLARSQEALIQRSMLVVLEEPPSISAMMDNILILLLLIFQHLPRSTAMIPTQPRVVRRMHAWTPVATREDVRGASLAPPLAA